MRSARSRSTPHTWCTATGARAGCGSDRGRSCRHRVRSSSIGPARTRCAVRTPDRASLLAGPPCETIDVVPRRTRPSTIERPPRLRSRADPWGNVAPFPDRTKYVPRCLSKMKLLRASCCQDCGGSTRPESMSNHTRPEIESHDEGQRLLGAARQEPSLFRHQGEADVRGQAECADRDDVAEDRCEAMTYVALVCPTVDEPGGRGSEDVAPEDLQDRQEVGRNALQGRVPSQEPRRQARESEEQEEPDQSRMVRGWRSGLAGHDGRRSRDSPAPEVEGDHDDHRIHEDGRYG